MIKCLSKKAIDPMFERDVPRIFKKNKDKVLLHMDSGLTRVLAVHKAKGYDLPQ